MAAAAIGETWSPKDVETWGQSGDLSAARGKLVRLHSTMGLVTLCDGAGDIVYGVVVTESSNSTTGSPVGILPCGSGKCVKVWASDVFAIGDLIGTTNAGLGVVKTADADHVIGISTEVAAASELVTVSLRPFQRAS
jgi:hypothetical protein